MIDKVIIGIKRKSYKNKDKKKIKIRIEIIEILKNREFYFMLAIVKKMLCWIQYHTEISGIR